MYLCYIHIWRSVCFRVSYIQRFEWCLYQIKISSDIIYGHWVIFVKSYLESSHIKSFTLNRWNLSMLMLVLWASYGAVTPDSYSQRSNLDKPQDGGIISAECFTSGLRQNGHITTSIFKGRGRSADKHIIQTQFPSYVCSHPMKALHQKQSCHCYTYSKEYRLSHTAMGRQDQSLSNTYPVM